MFKRRAEESGKSSMFRFAFSIFYVHIINIIIMLVLGMLLNNLDLVGITVSDWVFTAAVSIVCMLRYLIMTYIEGWRRGERDYNLVLYGHMEYNKFRGIIAGALAQIPGVLCAIILLFPSESAVAMRFSRFFYANFNFLFVMMDAGSFSYALTKVMYFVPALLAPVVVGISYHLGYARIRLSDKIIWRKPGEGRANLR